MKKFTSLLIVLFFISFCLPTISWASWPDIPGPATWDAEITRKIIYPWRATTAIVKSGENFEVWLNADQGQTVNSVQLKGPYNTVSCSHSILDGEWEYDSNSGNIYNTKVTVTVPAETPEDRYDLVLKTSTGDEVSWGGVKVIKEYKDNYYIMHISDGHIFQGAGDHDSEVLLARKSVMIDMANIMDIPIIIETGDLMYNIRNNPQHELAFHLGVESANIKGMADAKAATFYTPGNHDAPDRNNYANSTQEELAHYWNTYWGLQNHSFKYGNGRFMMINNDYYWRNNQHPAHDAGQWLSEDGAGGNFFLSAGHHWDRMHDIIHGYEPLDLILSGHRHYRSSENPWEFISGYENGYTAASIRDHFRFNLFRVNNSTGNYHTVPCSTAVAHALLSGNIKDRSTWELNLTLSFSHDNDGSTAENTATIVNHFDFPIMGARVRFVLPIGVDYQIVNGTIYQQFQGDEYQIVDVNTDVPANSTKVVYLNGDVDLCPDDPDKNDPGLCGCGVPEGECETSALKVNNGTGDGDYLPLENATIIAAEAPDGKVFDTWVVNSGNPFVYDVNSPFTEIRLEGVPAEITATYKDIPIVLVNEAEFVSQFIPPMAPGETVEVSVTMKNTGTSTWTAEENFRLGSQNPQGNTTWGFNRVSLGEDETVEPGAEKTFSFEITAPETEGTYRFQWRMLQENVEWFGDLTHNQHINIGRISGYIDECDSLTDWDSSGSLNLNSMDYQHGEGSIAFTGDATDEFRKLFANPINFSGSESNAILEFWYYISDPSRMSGSNQVELGSGGQADVDEFNWGLIGLVEGWNYIRLKLSEAGKIGNPDLSAINWFRFYSFKSGSITSMIDGIKITGMDINVSVKEFNSKNNVSVYPNPVYDNGVSVEFGLESLAKFSLSVLDMNGSVVSQPLSNRSFEPGTHKLDIPLINIQPGTYLIQIILDGVSQTHKIVVK